MHNLLPLGDAACPSSSAHSHDSGHKQLVVEIEPLETTNVKLPERSPV